MNTFSKKLDLILRYRKLSQKELAKKLELTPSAVNGYIKGTREPDFDTVAKIAKILDVDINCLFGLGNDADFNERAYDLIEGYSTDNLNLLFNSIGIPFEIYDEFVSGGIELSDEELEKIAHVFKVDKNYFSINHNIKKESPVSEDTGLAGIQKALKDLGIADNDSEQKRLLNKINNLSEKQIKLILQMVDNLKDDGD